MNFGKLLKQKDFLNKNWIYNRTVLYLIFIIALTDLFILFQERDIFSVVIFFLVGFLTAFFSKNMVVIMCMCLFFTNVLKYGSKSAASKEGFETTKEKENQHATDASGSDILTNMNPEKPETFDSVNTDKLLDVTTDMNALNVEKDELNDMMKNHSKILDNMNKYKPLLETIQKITSNVQVLKE